MESQEIEDNQDIRQRTRTLHKKFPEIEKVEEITEDTIWLLIEKLNLTEQIDKNMSKELFLELDVENTGKVNKAKFVDYINRNSFSDKAYKSFYETINEQLLSKSEKIILKLKKIKEKEYIKYDKTSLRDINWIITEITDSDIHEPEYSSLDQLRNEANKSGNQDNKNAVEYLSQFSKFWDHSRKEADLRKIKSTRLSKLISPIKRGNTFSHEISNFSEEFNLKEKKSIDSNRGSILLDSISSNPSSAILLANVMSKIDTSAFDIFELDNLINTKTVFLIANEIFERYQLLDLVDTKKFKEFITQIVSGYQREVTYHNDLHAGDVLQTQHCPSIYKLNKQLKLQEIDLISLFLSAIIHDFKHPGFNNMYQINSKSFIAIRYNDSSVLESYHVAQAFKVLLKPECNLLSTFSPEEFRTMRRRMIECVLATDMANHSRHVATFKSKIDSSEINNGHNVERIITEDEAKNFENQQLVLSNFLHAADISNPVKPQKVYDQWINLLFLEFFKQGDFELSSNLPVSLMCDRNTTNIDKSQVGFINFIVFPLWDLVYRIAPQASPYIENIKMNLKRYEEKVKNTENK